MLEYKDRNKRTYHFPEVYYSGYPTPEIMDRGMISFQRSLTDQGLTTGEITAVWVYSMQGRGWYCQYTYVEQVSEPGK